MKPEERRGGIQFEMTSKFTGNSWQHQVVQWNLASALSDCLQCVLKPRVTERQRDPLGQFADRRVPQKKLYIRVQKRAGVILPARSQCG